jgi:glutathione-regulated potassium-efflux system ancillary protein KefF
MILIIHAHPYPQHSRTTKAMLDAVRARPDVEIRSLYDLYPDFDIDIQAEQAALTRADLVVWLHPIYWYSVPAMMKYYFDVVLTLGWAYGEVNGAVNGLKAQALAGKSCLWVTSTGGTESSYTAEGVHQLLFDDIEKPIRQTALFCGMTWAPPIILHGAHVVSEADVAAAANQFHARLIAHSATQKGVEHAH